MSNLYSDFTLPNEEVDYSGVDGIHVHGGELDSIPLEADGFTVDSQPTV